jgi:hypothetical protein
MDINGYKVVAKFMETKCKKYKADLWNVKLY